MGVGGEHGEGLDRMGDLGWWLGSDIWAGGEFGVVEALDELSSRLKRKEQNTGRLMAISCSPTPYSIDNRSGEYNGHAATIPLRGIHITDSPPTGDALTTPSIRRCNTSSCVLAKRPDQALFPRMNHPIATKARIPR